MLSTGRRSTGVQARPPAADFIGEHPDGRLGQIHGGGARGRLTIHRAALRDEIRHQRDMDSDPQVAIRGHFASERVVDLERLFIVDREGDWPVDRGAFDRYGRDRLRLLPPR